MKTKEQIVNETCLTYLVKHLPKEIDRYYHLSDNHPCELAQWRLVTHLITILKTLTSLDTELKDEYKELFEMVDEFEKEK